MTLQIMWQNTFSQLVCLKFLILETETTHESQIWHCKSSVYKINWVFKIHLIKAIVQVKTLILRLKFLKISNQNVWTFLSSTTDLARP